MAIAYKECILQVISKANLLGVLKKFKKIKAEMANIAFGRMTHHNESKHVVIERLKKKEMIKSDLDANRFITKGRNSQQ
jgi:hypothetical protein